MIIKRASIEMEEATDPAELAEALARHEQFDRNLAWLQAHASEVYAKHRGKCICIAGEQLFVADSISDAIAQAQAAHPNDKGRFVHYIPRENVPRIYAHRRPLV